MSESGGGFDWKILLPDWLRRGRVADLTNVPIGKLEEAHKKRGVEVEITGSEPGKVTARVDKVVVKGGENA